MTLMGLGTLPASEPLSLGMLGMHGMYEANLAMHECDVMINIGARFDDRVTGRLDAFSPNSKKIHIDIDATSIQKNIKVDVPIVGDVEKIIEQIIAFHGKKINIQLIIMLLVLGGRKLMNGRKLIVYLFSKVEKALNLNMLLKDYMS